MTEDAKEIDKAFRHTVFLIIKYLLLLLIVVPTVVVVFYASLIYLIAKLLGI